MNKSVLEYHIIRLVLMVFKNSKAVGSDYDPESDSTISTLFGIIDGAYYCGCLSVYEYCLLEDYLIGCFDPLFEYLEVK